MSNLLMLWGGLKTVFSLSNLVIVIIGSLVGIIVGAVPGIGSLSACALLRRLRIASLRLPRFCCWRRCITRRCLAAATARFF